MLHSVRSNFPELLPAIDVQGLQSVDDLAGYLRMLTQSLGVWVVQCANGAPRVVAHSVKQAHSDSLACILGKNSCADLMHIDSPRWMDRVLLDQWEIGLSGVHQALFFPVGIRSEGHRGCVVLGYSGFNEGFRSIELQKVESVCGQIHGMWHNWVEKANCSLEEVVAHRTQGVPDEAIRRVTQLEAELRLANLRAEESSRLKQAFLANLSHEIRTPMNVMLGFGELLKDPVLSSSERREFVDIMNQNGLQLLQIMDNLIDIAKLQTDHSWWTGQHMIFNEWLEQFVADFKSRKKGDTGSVELVLEVAPQLVHRAYRIYDKILSKVLTHLLDNAFKFTSCGKVTIEAALLNEGLVVKVSDTGVGIPTGDEEVIFDLFRQADLNHTREYGGTGLGLSLVRKYLAIVGGNVMAYNNASGPGATFQFSLPILPA